MMKENIAYLGGIPLEPTLRQLHDRMSRLGNRRRPEDQAKILAAIHARVPMVTVEEQREAEEASRRRTRHVRRLVESMRPRWLDQERDREDDREQSAFYRVDRGGV